MLQIINSGKITNKISVCICVKKNTSYFASIKTAYYYWGGILQKMGNAFKIQIPSSSLGD